MKRTPQGRTLSIEFLESRSLLAAVGLPPFDGSMIRALKDSLVERDHPAEIRREDARLRERSSGDTSRVEIATANDVLAATHGTTRLALARWPTQYFVWLRPRSAGRRQAR